MSNTQITVSIFTAIGVFTAAFIALIPIFRSHFHGRKKKRVIRLQLLIEVNDLIRTFKDKQIVRDEKGLEPNDTINIPKENKDILKKLNQTLRHPPVNFFIHTLPNSIEKVQYYHWHIEVIPRVSNYGGYELGSGVVIDVVSPEDAARFLRKEKEPKKHKGKKKHNLD